MQQIDDEQLEGSGFQFDCFTEVLIEFVRMRDIAASSYIELPPKYKNSKSILNIQNEDNFCFLWCILPSLYPSDIDKHRTSNYAVYWSTLNIDGLEFPMLVKLLI